MTQRERPLSRARDIVLVGLGGGLGTLARFALTEVVPDAGGFPTVIAVINIVGAFLLGWLLSAISARGAENARRRAVRLLVGTGILGGFTTYGTFIDDEDMLLGMAGMTSTWFLFGLPTILLGIAAAATGAALGNHRHNRLARNTSS